MIIERLTITSTPFIKFKKPGTDVRGDPHAIAVSVPRRGPVSSTPLRGAGPPSQTCRFEDVAADVSDVRTAHLRAELHRCAATTAAAGHKISQVTLTSLAAAGMTPTVYAQRSKLKPADAETPGSR